MAITLRHHDTDDWAELTISGDVSNMELLRVSAELARQIEWHGQYRISEVVVGLPELDWLSLHPSAIGPEHLSAISHVACVSEHATIGPFTRAIGLLRPIALRMFRQHDRDAARTWIAGAGVGTGVTGTAATRPAKIAAV